jgi:RNA-directed DNA polymerase
VRSCARLKLELHPEKTGRVDLSWGRQGFDFLGCHLRKRMSGPIWEKERKRVYFLQRWPSTRSMTRVRQRVKEMTGRNRNGVKDVRVLIRDINPVLRGWGNYFRTGNAAVKFKQVDDYVRQRLRGFMVKRKGRNLRAGEASRWTHDFFHSHGLHPPAWDHQVPGGCVMQRTRETIGKPCAGNPHARFERGSCPFSGQSRERIGSTNDADSDAWVAALQKLAS